MNYARSKTNQPYVTEPTTKDTQAVIYKFHFEKFLKMKSALIKNEDYTSNIWQYECGCRFLL